MLPSQQTLTLYKFAFIPLKNTILERVFLNTKKKNCLKDGTQSYQKLKRKKVSFSKITIPPKSLKGNQILSKFFKFFFQKVQSNQFGINSPIWQQQLSATTVFRHHLTTATEAAATKTSRVGDYLRSCKTEWNIKIYDENCQETHAPHFCRTFIGVKFCAIHK